MDAGKQGIVYYLRTEYVVSRAEHSLSKKIRAVLPSCLVDSHSSLAPGTFGLVDGYWFSASLPQWSSATILCVTGASSYLAEGTLAVAAVASFNRLATVAQWSLTCRNSARNSLSRPRTSLAQSHGSTIDPQRWLVCSACPGGPIIPNGRDLRAAA